MFWFGFGALVADMAATWWALALGGVEKNPFTAGRFKRLLGINAALFVFALYLAHVAGAHAPAVWVAFGIPHAAACLWNLSQIGGYYRARRDV